MKLIYVSISLIFAILTMSLYNSKHENPKQPLKMDIVKVEDSVLRHVVLFKFKEGTSIADIKKVEDAFSELPSRIPEIMSYEWGLNNSPEGLEKGFTHCFFLTFKSEKDRAIYLPHPDHKAFGQTLSPYLEDVLVVDYWTN
ncbi:MAG: Dabb family protein [Maribacter sp.]